MLVAQNGHVNAIRVLKELGAKKSTRCSTLQRSLMGQPSNL